MAPPWKKTYLDHGGCHKKCCRRDPDMFFSTAAPYLFLCLFFNLYLLYLHHPPGAGSLLLMPASPGKYLHIPAQYVHILILWSIRPPPGLPPSGLRRPADHGHAPKLPARFPLRQSGQCSRCIRCSPPFFKLRRCAKPVFKYRLPQHTGSICP